MSRFDCLIHSALLGFCRSLQRISDGKVNTSFKEKNPIRKHLASLICPRSPDFCLPIFGAPCLSLSQHCSCSSHGSPYKIRSYVSYDAHSSVCLRAHTPGPAIHLSSGSFILVLLFASAAKLSFAFKQVTGSGLTCSHHSFSALRNSEAY